MKAYEHTGSKLPHPQNLYVGGMTQYKAEFGFPALFPPQSNENVLAEWLARHKVCISLGVFKNCMFRSVSFTARRRRSTHT